jgi:hypothetical protein
MKNCSYLCIRFRAKNSVEALKEFLEQREKNKFTWFSES